jgi:hypothetical protein
MLAILVLEARCLLRGVFAKAQLSQGRLDTSAEAGNILFIDIHQGKHLGARFSIYVR